MAINSQSIPSTQFQSNSSCKIQNFNIDPSKSPLTLYQQLSSLLTDFLVAGGLTDPEIDWSQPTQHNPSQIYIDNSSPPNADSLVFQTHGSGYMMDHAASFNNVLCEQSRILNTPIVSLDQTLTYRQPFPTPIREWLITQVHVCKKFRSRKIILLGHGSGAGLNFQGMNVVSDLIGGRARYLFAHLRLPQSQVGDSAHLSFIDPSLNASKVDMVNPNIQRSLQRIFKMQNEIATDDQNKDKKHNLDLKSSKLKRELQSFQYQFSLKSSIKTKFLFLLDDSDVLDNQIRNVQERLRNKGLEVEERLSQNKFHGWTIQLQLYYYDIIEELKMIKDKYINE